MSKYSKDERETVLVFDELTKQWRAWSTVPRHIRRLQGIGDTRWLETETDGTITAIDCYLAPSQIRFYDVPSESEKERLAEMRVRRIND